VQQVSSLGHDRSSGAIGMIIMCSDYGSPWMIPIIGKPIYRSSSNSDYHVPIIYVYWMIICSAKSGILIFLPDAVSAHGSTWGCQAAGGPLAPHGFRMSSLETLMQTKLGFLGEEIRRILTIYNADEDGG
jgi:hypothetical protein